MARGARTAETCLAVCVMLLSAAAAPARAEIGSPYVAALNKENITAFLEQTKALSEGRMAETPPDIAAYLNRHLTEKGVFRTMAQYDLPGFPPREIEMKYEKADYIANILEGQSLVRDYRTDIEIRDLKIENGGKSATLHTISTETGRMPWPDGKGGQEMLPIAGASECDQKLVVSVMGYIQMAGAECRTHIRFDAFGDRELDDEEW